MSTPKGVDAWYNEELHTKKQRGVKNYYPLIYTERDVYLLQMPIIIIIFNVPFNIFYYSGPYIKNDVSFIANNSDILYYV